MKPAGVIAAGLFCVSIDAQNIKNALIVAQESFFVNAFFY